ncbi:Uncharacterized protein TPAR_08346 [Tolypocladium paradoxum]|uniref:Uncharacterized protein n=1 Tax=Tolypocladium paradoxum TaxID=94208 RepID=A0A2S4KMM9_9HYPO|nr:Uncharacterized protein TPAR_08346 [Tolypocladium paradoxum]
MDEPATTSGSLSPPPPATDDIDIDITPRPARTKTPKNRRRPSKSPRRRGKSPLDSSDMESELSAAENPQLQPPADVNLGEELENEKQRYPGASTWARDEERLFEVLFLRQDLPLLPAHWDVDFRGVPMVDSIFQTSDEFPPIVYAHSAKEFQATMALLRLIDLTSSVRTACQSGLRRKAPALIKKGIVHFLNWAAEDGGYKFLRYVPNIAVEAIDADMDEGDITSVMQRRMRALARMQRDFLSVDRDPDFWDVDEQRARDPTLSMEELLLAKYTLDGDESTSDEWRSATDELATGPEDGEVALVKIEDGTKSQPDIQSLASGVGGELAENDNGELKDGGDDKAADNGEPPKATSSKQEPNNTDADADADPDATITASPSDTAQYRRPPPVVYGLFILRTSVFLLTVDAAKGETAYVSFHVDVHFMDRQQSVWNALTVAVAVCLARDELMARLADFEPADAAVESDPDA